MKKVLALNSSPRSDAESYTFMMLDQLVEGMREAGADVEVVNLRKKKSRIASAVSPAGPKRRASAFKRMI